VRTKEDPVSKEAQDESAQKSAEMKLHHFLDRLPAGAYMCDAEGLITYFNQHAVQLWGRAPRLNDPADRYCGSFKLFSIDGSPIAHDRCWMALALQTDSQYDGYEIIIERPDGERITALAHANPIHDDSGKLLGAVNILVDISDSKRREEASARLAAIVESSDDAIVAKTLEGVITAWNRGAEEIFGYTAAEAVGQHITLIIPPERRSEEDEVLARLRRGEKVDHFETVRQAKDGRTINISLTVSPIRNAHGQIIGASKVARDITERKRQEELLKEADRAKDEFLAMVSHELRTPLNAILGWSRIAQRDPSATRRALEIVERNARHQAKLIDDLIDLSRIASGKLRLEIQSVHVPHVIATAVESLRLAAEAKGVALELRLDTELPLVSGDGQRLHQVICNLLGNSIKFTPAGGRIFLNARQLSSTVEIRVRDTGKGISPKFLPHLFEAFRQGDGSSYRSGLGLGLAIVRHLIELHGGTIRAHSEGEGKGAEFTITLPLHENTPQDFEFLEPKNPAEFALNATPESSAAGISHQTPIPVAQDETEASKLSAGKPGPSGVQ
jgi:PAS domain S-box-containing protein